MRFIDLHLGFAIAIIPYVTRATQIPFQKATGAESTGLDFNDLSLAPDANATGNLIFRRRHNIVPGTVPVGTLLYHGRGDANLPTSPEWTATDPEHSYHFCSEAVPGGARNGGRVLASLPSHAANMKDGTLDAQDLLLWGKVDPERIKDMCAWGKELGIDGYVREVMLCDFHDGVELVSADFLTAWGARYTTPGWLNVSLDTDNTTNKTRPLVHQLLRFEMLRAGAWHNHHPGETRVVLDLTRLVSFYDPRPRANISATDLARVQARLRTVLTFNFLSDITLNTSANTEGERGSGSGVDWRSLFRVVSDRYAERLEMLGYLLNTTTPETVHERARVVQMQLRVMLAPYILHSARPPLPSASEAELDAWATPVWRVCATRHTAHIHTHAMTLTLTESEWVLLRALDETNREICRVVVGMWAAGVHAGLDGLIPPAREPASFAQLLGGVVHRWRRDADALLAWLDWGVWVKCRPACGVEETCYLPTWPYFWDSEEDAEDEEGEWKRPRPRCIRQFEPYSRL
ncbi:hypothetical protein B0H14DRAFT_2745952 [Mycena olivaceomarginata]|nr:hypothetical protein B0H14DRAFT_2745952 [Mycena olivaceomarginata]